jgi:periplasmic copper chaperone A
MLKRTIALGLAGALIVPAAAAAHITANPAEGPADGYATLDFEVPHGCEESPTTQVRVQIPETVPQATPEVHPGWSLETKEGPKEEVELHGETVTEGVSEVIWTAEDAPLPAHYLDRFAISVKLPAGEEGETVYFPTVQKCEKGQTGWIEIPAEGESAEELESPAPAVTLTAAEDEHGTAEEEPAADETATEPSEDDGDGMAIAALVVGGLGLVFGGASLMRNRK